MGGKRQIFLATSYDSAQVHARVYKRKAWGDVAGIVCQALPRAAGRAAHSGRRRPPPPPRPCSRVIENKHSNGDMSLTNVTHRFRVSFHNDARALNVYSTSLECMF